MCSDGLTYRSPGRGLRWQRFLLHAEDTQVSVHLQNPVLESVCRADESLQLCTEDLIFTRTDTLTFISAQIRQHQAAAGTRLLQCGEPACDGRQAEVLFEQSVAVEAEETADTVENVEPLPAVNSPSNHQHGLVDVEVLQRELQAGGRSQTLLWRRLHDQMKHL